MIDIESVFAKEALERAELVGELQEAIFNVTSETLGQVQEMVKKSAIDSFHVAQNIVIAAEYRPKKLDLLAKVFQCVQNAGALLGEFCGFAKSLLPEHLYFLTLCVKEGGAEVGPLLEKIETVLNEKMGSIDFVLNSYEKELLEDDVESFSKFFESESFAVDAKVSPSLLFGCHMVRDQPTLAQFAAFFGCVKCFKVLVEKGANLHMKDGKGRTLAQFAVCGGNREIIEMCKSAGCDFSGTMKIAVRFHHNEFVKDQVFTDNDTLPLLHQCVVSNNVRLMLYCIAHGSNVNQVDATGKCPIHIASEFNALDALELLMKCKQVNVNSVETTNKMTGLHIAALKGHVRCVQLILASELINQRLTDAKGRMPIHVAAEMGFVDVMKTLVSHGGVTLNTRNDYGETVLHLAVTGNHLDTVKYILAQPGVDIDAKTFAEETVLHCAASKGSVDTMKLILAHGVGDLNPHDRDGWTPLHDACGNLEVFKILLEHPGIDVNAKSKSGCTALQKGAAENMVDLVHLLVHTKGIRVNEQDINGWTAMHAAAKAGGLAAIKELVQAPGIDLNVHDGDGWTPLHSATKYQHHDVIEFLVTLDGIGINETTKCGWTPLHIACLNHDTHTRDLLRSLPGIILHPKDDQGRTPEDLEDLPLFGGEEGDIRLPPLTGMAGWDRLRSVRDYFND